MQQNPARHPNVIRMTGRHLLQKDGTVEYEIVVTTDLALDVLDPKHDKQKVDHLLAWAQQLLAATGVASRIVVTQR